MVNSVQEYDVIGIGFGPGNIAVAISLEEKNFTDSILFLEKNTAPDWQPEMLLAGSDIQHNPLRDFVTPRDPCNKYGFLSFLKNKGRLFDYLNLNSEYPLRLEYAQYIRWVARHFDRWVSYGEFATNIEFLDSSCKKYKITTNLGRLLLAKSVVFAPGRSPNIPDIFKNMSADHHVSHFTQLETSLANWEQKKNLTSLAIIGNSQSAIEIVLELKDRYPNIILHNIYRGYSYQLKDTSPFTEHLYFPDFVETFYKLPAEEQNDLMSDLWRSNYSSADRDVIDKLYLKIYEEKISGRERTYMHNMSVIQDVKNNEDFSINLSIFSSLKKEITNIVVDGIILATGFKNLGKAQGKELYHPLLSNIMSNIKKRGDSSLYISRDYCLELNSDERIPFIINGLCESTHGFGDAGSFSLLSVRSWEIASTLESFLNKS